MRCQSSLLILLLGLVLGPVVLKAAAVEGPRPTLEEKVGQLFMLGVPEKSVDAKLQQLIHETKPGGFIFFRRNLGSIPVIQTLTSDLKEISLKETGVLPLLAVDQEGGPVVRIPVFPPLPSAYSVGSAARQDLSQALGEETGKILRWCGFNMNLAPVLDLSDPFKPSFIGARSYSADPGITGQIGLSFATGLRNTGVLPTAKHFPGLGPINLDPHKDLTERTTSASEMDERDLKPFRAYAQLGVNSALMISQLSYPKLDKSGLPAAFSKRIISDLLREQIGYRGLIVTDDLQMKGVALLFSPEEAALKSLEAGVDIVMISWSAEQQRKAIRRVIKAVNSGEWSVDELNKHYERIVAIKKFLLLSTTPEESQIAKGPEGQPGTRRLEEVDLKILDENLGRASSRRPASDESVKPGGTCVLAAKNQFLESYRRGSHTPYLSILIDQTMTAGRLQEKVARCESVVFAVNGAKTAHLLGDLKVETLKKTILVNLGLPLLVDAKLPIRTRLELGSSHPSAGFRVAQKVEASLHAEVSH